MMVNLVIYKCRYDKYKKIMTLDQKSYLEKLTIIFDDNCQPREDSITVYINQLLGNGQNNALTPVVLHRDGVGTSFVADYHYSSPIENGSFLIRFHQCSSSIDAIISKFGYSVDSCVDEYDITYNCYGTGYEYPGAKVKAKLVQKPLPKKGGRCIKSAAKRG